MAISYRDIASFLKAAIEAGAVGAPGQALGETIRNVEVDPEARVRFNLSDGSLIIIDIEHLVPRNYWRGGPVVAGNAVIERPLAVPVFPQPPEPDPAKAFRGPHEQERGYKW